MLKLVPKPAELWGITELDWVRLQVLWQGGGSAIACEEHLQYCTHKQENATREREAKARTRAMPSPTPQASVQQSLGASQNFFPPGWMEGARQRRLVEEAEQREEIASIWQRHRQHAQREARRRAEVVRQQAEAEAVRVQQVLAERAAAKSHRELATAPERHMGIGINDFAQAGIEWLRSQTARNNELQKSSQTQLARSERNAQIQERQACNAIERERSEAEIAWCNRMLDVLHSPADMSVVDDWWND